MLTFLHFIVNSFFFFFLEKIIFGGHFLSPAYESGFLLLSHLSDKVADIRILGHSIIFHSNCHLAIRGAEEK
jgi:hypothetical protein